MDTATAKRNALLQRRTPGSGNNRTTARVTRPAPVAAPPPRGDEQEEELPQAFGKGINNDSENDSEEEKKNGESVDDEEDDPYSPLNGPSPSPAPPRYDDPQQPLRGNHNNPKTAIRAGAIERPKSIATQQQQKLQRQNQPPPTSTTASQPPSVSSASSYLDEYIFKVCVVGNHNVGKTSLVRRMCNPILPSSTTTTSNSANTEQILHTRPTIGVDFSSRVVENIRPGALVRMQLWDTAGLEKFAAVSAPVYRNCAGVIAVVDVLNRDTLDALVAKWLPAVLGQLPTLPLSSVLVLCNKMDLLESFTTTSADISNNNNKNGHIANVVLPQGVDPSKFTNAGEVAQVLSKAGINDTLIMEVSAKSGLNVEDAISLLCNRIIDKIATTTTTTEGGDVGRAGAAAGNRNDNGGGDGAEAKSPGKPPKSRKEEEVKKAVGSDDDDDEDGASPRESNTDFSNKYPAISKNTAAAGGGRSQIVNLQDAKKSEPLEASTSSSVRSKKSNATYCPC